MALSSVIMKVCVLEDPLTDVAVLPGDLEAVLLLAPLSGDLEVVLLPTPKRRRSISSVGVSGEGHRGFISLWKGVGEAGRELGGDGEGRGVGPVNCGEGVLNLNFSLLSFF